MAFQTKKRVFVTSDSDHTRNFGADGGDNICVFDGFSTDLRNHRFALICTK